MASFRQFRLLMTKNLILMWRNKLWTIFEIVVPILLVAPLLIWSGVRSHNDVKHNSAYSLVRHTITGSSSDLPTDSWNVWFCSNKSDMAHFGYVMKNTNENLKILEELKKRYEKASFTNFSSETDLWNIMKSTTGDNELKKIRCDRRASNLTAGIVIEELDVSRQVFRYKIIIFGRDLDLDKNWDSNPFAANNDHEFRIEQDPYLESAFLSYQFALDSIFIQDILGKNVSDSISAAALHLNLEEKQISGVFMFFTPMIGMAVFLVVVHTASEITTEKNEVKLFLSVMGLSPTMFYITHILFAWCKCLIVVFACAGVLYKGLRYVSTVYFLLLALYSLAAVCFAAMMGSVLKKPNTALLATVFLWFCSVAHGALWDPDRQNIYLCLFGCLNINGAFQMARLVMTRFMDKDVVLGYTNMFEDASTEFGMGPTLLMLVFDIILMITVMFLVDFLRTHDLIRWRKLFKTICCCGKDGRAEAGGLRDSWFEKEDETMQADIKVDNLQKFFWGEPAVKNLTFRAYKGQVTALLGHNGAGKSTTFSIICGMVAPTDGSVEICEMDIRSDLKMARKNIGYCPQTNALFPKLTVMEHLWLIHGLKGIAGNYEEEALLLLEDLKMMDSQNIRSSKLSGGLKRKLCVAMALIGESQVVLLDEPTAGMDPGARKDVARLLERNKQDRTVLLTTHYMDEAELLGERIIIMESGSVLCSGTSQFLKNRFGSGYTLTVITNEEESQKEIVQQIESLVKTYVPSATMEKVQGNQIDIVLPKDSQEKFADLFEKLEEEKTSHHIKSFGLSLDNLEQVFLKVGELAEKARKDYKQESYKAAEEDSLDRTNTCEHLFMIVWAMFYKRFLYSFRNWGQLLAQFIIPFIIILLVARSNIKSEEATRDLSVKNFGNARIIINDDQMDQAGLAEAYSKLASINKNKVLFVKEGSSLLNTIEQQPMKSPAVGLGVDFSNDTILYTERHPHAAPISMNLFSNAHLLGRGSISTSIRIFITSIGYAIIMQYIVPLLNMAALALLTSTFVMFLVEERMCKYTHQQLLTGITSHTFYICSMFYEFVFYCMACAGFMIIFVIYDWYEGNLHILAIIWIAYFLACTPLMYAVSFMFKSPHKANLLLIVFQILAAFACVLATFMLPWVLKPNIMEIFETVTVALIPSYALFQAMFHLQSQNYSNPWSYKCTGKYIMLMCIFGCISTILFYTFSMRKIRFAILKACSKKPAESDANLEELDEDVKEERESVKRGRHGKYVVRTVDLVKSFGQYRAVDGLSFGVKNEESVGLLGVNGAGKTTTFDILTGQSFITSGVAEIYDESVTTHKAIGYCPQFDAMLMDLTGKENLYILALLHGMANAKARVKYVLKVVGMTEQRNKLVKHYSGGQKRKISVAMAILSSAKLIILDEPTAGIDPKARRDIWSVLSLCRIQDKSAILLTSHSMDECEALCSKIVMIARGRVKAVGPSQALKSKYGNSYTLTFCIKEDTMRTAVMDAVQKAFSQSKFKTNKNSTTLNLQWIIPKEKDDRWSALFRKCHSLAEELKNEVAEFCITQSSLEETFLRIAGENTGGDSVILIGEEEKQEPSKTLQPSSGTESTSKDLLLDPTQKDKESSTS